MWAAAGLTNGETDPVDDMSAGINKGQYVAAALWKYLRAILSAVQIVLVQYQPIIADVARQLNAHPLAIERNIGIKGIDAAADRIGDLRP